MKRTILIFGLILGVILCSHMLYMTYQVYNNPDLNPNDLMGYVAMIVAFSLTFFGILNYRNKVQNGFITLGKAFKVGALIALAGSTMYVIVWLFDYYLFVPDWMEVYSQCVLDIAEKNGATAQELATKKAEMDQFSELYENPLFVILITYAEVLPIGLIVSFISALILKKKPKID